MIVKTAHEVAEEVQSKAGDMLTVHELMVSAIEADRAQRRLILSAPADGVHIWVDEPEEALEQVAKALSLGYRVDRLEWEDQK